MTVAYHNVVCVVRRGAQHSPLLICPPMSSPLRHLPRTRLAGRRDDLASSSPSQTRRQTLTNIRVPSPYSLPRRFPARSPLSELIAPAIHPCVFGVFSERPLRIPLRQKSRPSRGSGRGGKIVHPTVGHAQVRTGIAPVERDGLNRDFPALVTVLYQDYPRRTPNPEARATDPRRQRRLGKSRARFD